MRGKGQTTSTDANSGWLRRLSRACWRYPRNLLLALAGTLVVSLVGIAIPLIQRAIVDNLTSAAQAAIWPLAVALIVAAVANFGGLYVRRYRGRRPSPDLQHDLRTPPFSPPSPLAPSPPTSPRPCPGGRPPARTSCTPARSSAGRSPTSR